MSLQRPLPVNALESSPVCCVHLDVWTRMSILVQCFSVFTKKTFQAVYKEKQPAQFSLVAKLEQQEL